MDKATKFLNRYTSLEREFQPWRDFYREVSRTIWPSGGAFSEDGKPNSIAKYHGNMLSDTGEYANKILGAGMQSLNSPYRNWFVLGLLDKDLEKSEVVKEYLEACERVMRRVFANSNYYATAHRGYEEQGAFGTECMFMEEDLDDVVWFTSFTAGEYMLASSNGRTVDIVYRRFWMTAEQIIRKFGRDNVSQSIRNSADKKSIDYFEIIHAVEPREDRDDRKIDSLNMPFASVWFEKNNPKQILRESGYTRFPAVTPRWSVRGQNTYGIGPGHSALGRANMVQEMEKSSLKGIHQAAEPSIVIPAKYNGIVDLTPASVTVAPTIGDAKIGRLFDFNIPIDVIEAKKVAIERGIERSFYNDLFLMIDAMTRSGRDMTATEVIEHKEEKILMLGPTIERQIKEKLDPVVKYVFEVCLERGLFPPPPQDLQGQEIKIEYVSLLAQSQKLITAQSMRAYMAEVGNIAAIDPQSTIKTDFNKYLQEYADAVGIPASITRTDDQIEKIMMRIEQQRQAEEQKQEELRQAEVMNKLGSASVSDGTALGELRKQTMGL